MTTDARRAWRNFWRTGWFTEEWFEARIQKLNNDTTNDES